MKKKELAERIKTLESVQEEAFRILDGLSGTVNLLKTTGDHLDLNEKIEELRESFNSAYARTAERRLERLETQNDNYRIRETELIHRWKAHVLDLKEQLADVKAERTRLLALVNHQEEQIRELSLDSASSIGKSRTKCQSCGAEDALYESGICGHCEDEHNA